MARLTRRQWVWVFLWSFWCPPLFPFVVLYIRFLNRHRRERAILAARIDDPLERYLHNKRQRGIG